MFILNIIQIKIFNHISSMHVDDYQGVEGDWLVLGEFSSDELDSTFELSGQALIIFFQFVFLEVVLDLCCPMDLTSL